MNKSNEKVKALYELYFMYCKEKGLKPSNGSSLEQFMSIIQR